MKKNIIYLFLCLSLLSCEKTIDFKETSVKPFMVLNSYINPNNVISAEITKSQSVIKEFKVERITNAEVSVYENDGLFEKLNYNAEKECYIGTKMPMVGNTYTIKASANGFANISSNAVIPVKTTVSEYSFEDSSTDSWESRIDATIKIKDDGKKKNFYRIVVEEEIYYANREDGNYTIYGSGFNKTYEWNGNILKKWFSIESKDPVLTGKGQSGSDEYFDDIPDNIFAVFNDELFDGEEYSLEFSFNTYYSDGLPQRVNVYVMSITEEYYLYLKSYASQIYFDDSPFSEPVQIYSNINNGAGIMGAYNYEKILVYDKMNKE